MGLGRRLPALVRDRAVSGGPVLRTKEPEGVHPAPLGSGGAAEAEGRPDPEPMLSTPSVLPSSSALHLVGYFYSYSG